DIESSTALWSACSELMPDAVATHHRLIRVLIAKYGCYEVKTVGDSFMIACKSVFAAVQLVRELQQVFLRHEWETSALDAAYRKFEEGRAEETEGYVPPTARLDAAVYRQYWGGLRVRAGVHTGLCDIRRDEVTKGYDYYGDTANMAARTESVGNGGQVLLTRAAYMALSTAEREEVDVTALGAVALRGVPRPVEMYQVDAVPGRTFAALRLDREAAELDDGGEEWGSSDEASASTAMSGVPNTIVTVLAVLFGTFAAPLRLKMLRPLCERWRVSVPRGVGAGHEEACRVAMERLASKMGRVMEKTVRKLSAGCDPRTESLHLMSAFQSSDTPHLFNAAAEREGRLVERPSHSGLWRASLSQTKEEYWEMEDSDAIIHVSRRV
ncbi:receptor-type adenylate cyclase, partial [Trypanosoma rangeli]